MRGGKSADWQRRLEEGGTPLPKAFFELMIDILEELERINSQDKKEESAAE